MVPATKKKKQLTQDSKPQRHSSCNRRRAFRSSQRPANSISFAFVAPRSRAHLAHCILNNSNLDIRERRIKFDPPVLEPKLARQP